MRVWILGLVIQLFLLREFTSADTPDVRDEFVSLGGTVTFTITNRFSDVVTSCLLETPQGVLHQFRPESNSTNEDFALQPTSMLSSCSVAIKNVKEKYLGEWTLYSNIRDASHNEFQLVQAFQIIDRDAPVKESSESNLENESSETPELITEEPTTEVPELTTEVLEQPNTELQIKTLEEIQYETPLKIALETSIPRTLLNTVESCHLRTPDGVELVLSADLEYPGLQVTEGNLMSSCIITMTMSEEMNGDWELYSRETNKEEQYKIRQPFTISIEEPIGTFPKDTLTVSSGRDLYIRLDQTIEDVKSCALVPPDSAATRTYSHDARYASSCGFVVPFVSNADAGKWTIVANGRIGYKGQVDVAVEDTDHPVSLTPVTVKHGEPVEMDVGPQNALFCQLRDPEGSIAFRGFRACKLDIEAATRQHAGDWVMRVGLPGRLSPVFQVLSVHVEEPELMLNSITHKVEYSEGSAALSCSMLTDHTDPASFCKFIRPDNEIFVLTEGVGEGRYSYSGNGVSTTESGHTLVECGLHISTVILHDLGTWRCLLGSEEGEASSFLRVSNVDLASEEAISADAVLVASTTSIVALAGQELTMSCSVNAYVDYCWFRSQNGTVITVAPGVSTPDYEYVGGGFSAGECGLRLRAASTADSGLWSCNVGLRGLPDRSVGIDVVAYESPLVVSQNLFYRDRYSIVLVVEGTMYNNSALDYCRFVSPLGEGFSTSSSGITWRYDTSRTVLDRGMCRLTVRDPRNNEMGTWTVAAALNATGQEVSARTLMPSTWTGGSSTATYIMVVVIVVCLNVCFISIFVNKRSRRWTTTRASSVGNSLRNSFRRQRTQEHAALKDAPPTYDTAMGTTPVNQHTSEVNPSLTDANQHTIEVNEISTDGNHHSTNMNLAGVDQIATVIDLSGSTSSNERTDRSSKN